MATRNCKPIPPLSASDIERFWKNVLKTSHCWIWAGGTFGCGRPRLTLSGSQYRASRISYFIAFGIDLGNKYACHTCDVSLCVFPEHLFSGTASDNSEDMVNKGRSARGERIGNTTLNPEQVGAIRERYPLLGYGRTVMLAKEYNTTPRTILNIVTGRTWKYTTPESLVPAKKQLAPEGVLAIRAMSATTSGVEIAKLFGVSKALVSLIINKRIWQDI